MTSMIQLNPPIGVYIPSQNIEGYAHIFIYNGLEDFQFFEVLTDKGEWWLLSNRDIRGTFNFSAGRPKQQIDEKD